MEAALKQLEEQMKGVSTPPAAPVRSKRRGILLVIAVLAIAGTGAAAMYFYGRGRVSTDDAQVDGHIAPIAAKIPGNIAAIFVEDNQRVKAGQVLVQIDARDYQARVGQARAALQMAETQAKSANITVPLTDATTLSGTTAAEAQLEAAKSELSRAEAEHDRLGNAELAVASANLETQRATLERAQADLGRMKMLVDRDEISKLQFDAYLAAARVAEGQWNAAKEKLAAAEKQADSAEASLGAATARVEHARAALEQTRATRKQVDISAAQAATAAASVAQARANLQARELELSYTTIAAPIGGVITRKVVQLGQIIQPGQSLLTIVPLDDVWVTANFKETQLANVHPGQKGRIKVDHVRAHVRRARGFDRGRDRRAPEPAAAGKRDRELRQGGPAHPGEAGVRRRSGRCRFPARHECRGDHTDAVTAVKSEAAGGVNPWLVAMSVMLATFMEVLDTSVANVALPHIAGNLSASVDESAWVLTSYLVANAVVLPLSGWFSTLFGRKKFYLVCVVLFTLSSLACGFAPSLGMLILFRILQGLGGGSMQPIAQAILVESFPKSKQGMAMAVYGMGVILAPVIGPTLGGWITDDFTWRWIFFINIPIGVVAFIAASMFVFDPEYLERKSFGAGLKLDFIGLSLIVTGLAFLEIMLDEGQRRDWFASHLIGWSAGIAACCLTAVVFWELRQKDPVIELHMLKNRNFALATGTMYVVGFMLYGSTMLLPVFLQTLLGYTALLSGLVLSPGGLLVLVTMPVVGVLLGRMQPRRLMVFGLCVCAVAMFRMSGFNLTVDFRTALLARCVQMFGMAFLFAPINVAAFAFIAKEQANKGTGFINLARNIGGSAGIATATTLLARRQQFHQQVLVSHLTPLDSAYQELSASATQMLAMQGASPADAAQQSQALLYGLVQRHAAMLSFADVFWLMAIVCVTIVPLALCMRNVPLHNVNRAE